MFDGYLQTQAQDAGAAWVPFDDAADYQAHVDGRSRDDGTRSFLRSRAIELPDGCPSDQPGAPTIAGLSAAKDTIVLRRIRQDGVTPYPGSVRYVRAVRSAGLLTAVVSSSANCAEVLDAAGITGLFDVRVDGRSVQEHQLAGKPAPDSYLLAARSLTVGAGESAVFEDALSGVAAGRAGGFAVVVGVDRVGQAEALRSCGADLVVTDLGDLLSLDAPA